MKDENLTRPGMAMLSHERHFYSTKRAFGHFGIRIFDPVLMTQPHWHCHIEANFATDFEMEYQVDGQVLMLPANRLVVSWQGCRIS